MRRIIIFTTLICIFTISAKAQLVIDNATLFIQAGATVTVQGDVTSNVDIQGTGLLQLKGSALQNVNMNGFTIPNLELDNTSNATLTGNARIGASMLFTNGKFQLGTNNLLIAPTATITGNTSARFVMTNSTGVLTKQGLTTTPFVYPVGFSSTEYNPLTITNTGTTDDISVRCLQNVLANGISGSPVTSDFANNSWVVSEAVAGGSNLSMTGEWALGDELTGFNRAKSGVARFNTGTDWDLPASNVLAAAGAGPYTRNRSALNTIGVFAVADLDKVNAAKLNLKVFLQGPYNNGTGVMSDALRVANTIPLTQPYSSAMSARFTRVGVYDGSVGVNESVSSNAIFDPAGTNDDIVDWVYISLNDGVTPSTKLQTRAALLQRDGDIVEYNPVSLTYDPVTMPIDADGNYHIVVGHRNHLSIRTPATLSLSDNTTTAYSFTTAQAQAYQNIAITANTAMAPISGTFPTFAMWAGNVNANTQVKYSGGANDNLALLTILGGNTTIVLSGQYSLGDLNMNSNVRYTGSFNDNLVLLSVLSGNTTVIFTEHQ